MGDANLTAEDRLRALPGIGPYADLTAPFWRQLPSTVIWLMEAHAAAAVTEYQARVADLEAEVERLRDLIRGVDWADAHMYLSNSYAVATITMPAGRYEALRDAFAPQENKQ